MTHEPQWHLMGRSVRGASHIRSGLPNQDAICWLPESGSGPPLILAVSDGHGSTKSFRSDLGSAFAVEAAAHLLQELVDVLPPDPQRLSAVKRTAEERLPQELVRRWQQAVDRHLAEHPFTEEELARLTHERGEASCHEVEANARLAYGATILAVLAAREFLLFLQLGDGDILTVAETGEVTRPMARDARLMANETTSLCMERAWREVRLRFQARYGGLPALIVVATDGYANSFINESAFLKVGSDLLAMLQEDGVASVEGNLVSWLQEASEAGSGDDITLGLLYRDDAVAKARAAKSTAQATPAAGEAAEPVGEDASAAREAEGAPTTNASRSEAAPDGEQTAPDEKQVVPDGEAAKPAGGQPGGDQRARMVERLKQEGPREPAKHVSLAELDDDPPAPAGEDEAETDDAAST